MIAPTLAAAEDWGTFAARSTHADDPILLQALSEGDFTEKVAICSSIGRRDDSDVADVIEWLLERNAGNEKAEGELLLRLLLQGLSDPSRGGERIRSNITENAGVLGSMISRIDRWTDPQLKSLLVRLFPFMPVAEVLPPLLTVGSGLVNLLASGEGLIPSQEMDLAMDYLSVVETMKCSDSFEQCAALARLSREKVLVDRARAVAGVLLAK
jgi:hypothetical protein